MPRKRPLTPTPPRYCDHCGGRMTSAGRVPAKLEKAFCSKLECRAAKQRAHYALRRGAEVQPDAPTTCSCCETPLSPRKVRFGDSPLGRWCRRARCQEHRRSVLAHASTMTPEQKANADFVAAMGNPEMSLSCKACGLENALVGFKHPHLEPDGSITRCDALGTKGASVALIQARWPEQFPA